MIRSDLYIDGQWVATPNRHPVYDPSDGSIITEIAIAGDKEIDAAVDAADRAFPAFAKMPARVRGEILRRAFEIMIAEADDLARLVSRENGKVFADAKGEVL
jgi:succinate-semialdehyde dehydrogenase/glutarate-semialdehyde dehydrogenase